MFTVLFAVARTVGWISQPSEMMEDPKQKIGRPRQLYTGVGRRDYVDIAKRKQTRRLAFESRIRSPRPAFGFKIAGWSKRSVPTN
jgi:hypothetical protein